MKQQPFRKIAVLGSGIMGARIACLFASIELPVLLFDLASGSIGDSEVVRNAVALKSLSATLKAKPASLYLPSQAKLIQCKNFDDHLAELAQADLIIEAVVERMDIKVSILKKVAQYVHSDALVTTNTSGLSIAALANALPNDIQQRFAATHFFNPPRYLQLLEIVPTPLTTQSTIEKLKQFAENQLGKSTLIAKDTPAFIANRIGVFSIMALFHNFAKYGFTLETIDKLTGTIIGRPKSATFRTCDVVGIDTLIKVAENVYQSANDDPKKTLFAIPPFLQKMANAGQLGDKTAQGFYKKQVIEGKKTILSLNLATGEYEKLAKQKLPVFDALKNIQNPLDSIKLLANDLTQAGEFMRSHLFGLFEYAATISPTIADHWSDIDVAMRSGFGWEHGPFEIWDALGVSQTIPFMEMSGYTVPAWVKEMAAKGQQFYTTMAHNAAMYDIATQDQKIDLSTVSFIHLKHYKNAIVWQNAGCSLYDIGDGVLNLAFHTKMNSIGVEILTGVQKAIAMAENEFEGLVIGQEGANFSAGANLGLLFMLAIEQDFDEIDQAIRLFQKTAIAISQSKVPVVAALKGLTLGGGCEFSMHAAAKVYSPETYIGLVETGVGLIPGGGGSKAVAQRIGENALPGDVVLNKFQQWFTQVAMAKVATSGLEALEMGYLQATDWQVMQAKALLSKAKQKCLQLASEGYKPVSPQPVWVLGQSALALAQAGVYGLLQGKYISEHDAKVANKLAYVLAGGPLSAPQYVESAYLLDLEREAFLSLCGERKTLQRIESIIKTGKPLRN